MAIISKDDAARITVEYYTWEASAMDFIDVIDNAIRYQASIGHSETTVEIPNSLAEQSLNMALQAINDAGYTDVEVNETDSPMTVTIKWNDIHLVSVGSST